MVKITRREQRIVKAVLKKQAAAKKEAAKPVPMEQRTSTKPGKW